MNLTKRPIFQKSKIVKDKKYLKWVCDHFDCFTCESRPVQAHHLQGKYRIGAMLRCDSKIVPLCYSCHYSLTFIESERKFWNTRIIDPMPYAKELYKKWRNINDSKKRNIKLSKKK